MQYHCHNPSALFASAPEVSQALLDVCSHLFVDDAHHVEAATLRQIRDSFNGKAVLIDDKLLCVPRTGPGWSPLEALADVPRQLRDEIAHFFSIYKDLEPEKHVEIDGWYSVQQAEAEIEASRRRFREASHDEDEGGT